MKAIAGILIIGLLSACASQTTQPDVEERSTAPDSGYGADGSALGSDGTGFHPLNDPNNILSQRSVFYDFDSYTVKNEYRQAALSINGHYLDAESSCQYDAVLILTKI